MDDAYRAVTYGASLRFPSHQIEDEDIEAVRTLQKTLSDPYIRKQIEDRVKITLPDIVKHPEHSPSWPELMARAKSKASNEYKYNLKFEDVLDAIDVTMEGIVEEQAKLKQLILSNMRKTMDLDRSGMEQSISDMDKLNVHDTANDIIDRMATEISTKNIETVFDVQGIKMEISAENTSNPKWIEDGLPGIVVRIDNQMVTRSELEKIINAYKEAFVEAYNKSESIQIDEPTELDNDFEYSIQSIGIDNR